MRRSGGSWHNQDLYSSGVRYPSQFVIWNKCMIYI
jgi:hypothetical protein